MTTHYTHIYKHRAADYHRLITPEDTDGNLLPALQRVTPLRGKRILDLGTGTGRLPLLLRDVAAHLIGLDLHRGMLQEHQVQRNKAQGRWPLIQGDMRKLPLPNNWADVVTAGWAIGHFISWFGDDWTRQVSRVLQEMRRMVTPDGALIIIETLTTGSLNPAPPTSGLADYYAWLERKWGFTRQEIQTDYQFNSVEEAAVRSEFFFDPAISAAIREQGWTRVPEWTGVWSKAPGA
ncbi:MAG TPA: class I SAM-dependent methyltransferase [Chloroflexi bacterium]|nr:class I SAM-dependent methyltransferase [Chloroflexota bacterium]